jgi:hypothetical protein
MDDREKALELVQKCLDDWPYAATRVVDIMKRLEQVKVLLKAQGPVEPKMMEFVDKGLTWEKYEVPTCGVCGALLGDALFCPMCGRAVKWE